jgi:hypothetical protein
MKNDIVLRLYHGRKDPKEELEGWGVDGPSIGPLSCVVSTYTSQIRLFTADNNEVWLDYIEDMVLCAGYYYGDYEIMSVENALELGYELTSLEALEKQLTQTEG